MRRLAVMAAVAAAMVAQPAAQAQRERQPPYWASISAGKALMRTGPGRTYPATWLYVRADLPIRVIETYPSWRKVQDPDGTTGWMLVNLLSDTRTAIVTGDAARPLHESADAGARVRFRAEPGVVGRISRCASGWCQFAVGNRRGFIRTEHVWGVDADEVVK
ncbi:MAG: SH3 domain-containing protein [Allosphingosinicella sp.]|uniref:SH3 domain-containing protein n=1 Tax=Allosphingosinicella sp. TaxID=2823234 RepID=UPI003940A3D1